MKAKPTILTIFFVFFLFGSVFAQDGELPGDANCDGVVNVLDIITMANYFTGNEPDPFCFENADVNGDGAINIMDIILTVDIFLTDTGFACGDNITFTYRGQEVTYGTIKLVGRCWMDRNLGASRVPTSSTDSQGYGDLFQWGRLDDGHQDRTSSTTPGPVNQDVPGHGSFITVGSYPYDWRSPENNELWQGEDGINNPCPLGWRVPTRDELNAERLSWGSNNSAGAYASTLKWPVGGRRGSNGALGNVGSVGRVWSSSVSGSDTYARSLNFYSGSAAMSIEFRADGRSVRCVRDNVVNDDIIYGDGVTDIDGNVYQTVIIGNQEWMAENLRVTSYKNGDAILTGLDNTEWASTVSGTYAVHPHINIDGLDSEAEVLEAYGKLYNWYAVADERGLCPEGWSVPSDDDWTALVDYVADQGFPNHDVVNGAGNALKSCRQVNSPLGGDCITNTHPRWNFDVTHSGFDEFGFSALPGGIRVAGGNFANIGLSGSWWSSSEASSADAWGRHMVRGYGGVLRPNVSKQIGYGVRCFRDIDN